jgi:hypothetical protein
MVRAAIFVDLPEELLFVGVRQRLQDAAVVALGVGLSLTPGGCQIGLYTADHTG